MLVAVIQPHFIALLKKFLSLQVPLSVPALLMTLILLHYMDK